MSPATLPRGIARCAAGLAGYASVRPVNYWTKGSPVLLSATCPVLQPDTRCTDSALLLRP